MMSELAPITDLLERTLGMAAATVGPRVVESAVRRRLDATRAASPAAYVNRLRTDRQELAELVDAVIVPETWFFRYPESFRHLGQWAAERRTGLLKPLRLLSVPCCSGEESYSVAMALIDAGLPVGGFKVDGVDISGRLVEFAAHGVYCSTAFRETATDVRGRHFDAVGDTFAVKPLVKTAVSFRVGNLADPLLLTGEPVYDAIFCRNLFIYLTPAAKQTAVNSLDRLLAPDGLVFMGHAEPLGLMNPKFKTVGPPQAFAFGRAGTQIVPALKVPEVPVSKPPPHPKPRAVANPPAAVGDLLAEARAAADAGRLADAVTLAERAVGDGRSTADGFALLGVVRLMGGDHPAAEAAFTRALYLDPRHFDALIHMMALAERRGDQPAAANYRRRAAAARGADR